MKKRNGSYNPKLSLDEQVVFENAMVDSKSRLKKEIGSSSENDAFFLSYMSWHLIKAGLKKTDEGLIIPNFFKNRNPTESSSRIITDELFEFKFGMLKGDGFEVYFTELENNTVYGVNLTYLDENSAHLDKVVSELGKYQTKIF